VDGVLPLVTAKLLHFELLRHRAFVLGRRVIPTFALGALHRDDFSSLARHVNNSDSFSFGGALDEI
jgi:hypothetical protein